ncbi:hypothetical protein [Streptomyces showdoensis]|uniref:hypothetical protein n=1 Tax=Streptomyces showdoensis TaxID=68268 RepID=UPI0013F4C73B|nr:hypothetical protein [Streptomyces showdoensis]
MPETIEMPRLTAAELNEQIRVLVRRGLPAAAEEYQRLVVAWAEAMRAEQALAA